MRENQSSFSTLVAPVSGWTRKREEVNQHFWFFKKNAILFVGRCDNLR
jgi:hypothetical protein